MQGARGLPCSWCTASMRWHRSPKFGLCLRPCARTIASTPSIYRATVCRIACRGPTPWATCAKPSGRWRNGRPSGTRASHCRLWACPCRVNFWPVWPSRRLSCLPLWPWSAPPVFGAASRCASPRAVLFSWRGSTASCAARGRAGGVFCFGSCHGPRWCVTFCAAPGAARPLTKPCGPMRCAPPMRPTRSKRLCLF